MEYIVNHSKTGTNFVILWKYLHNDLVNIKNSELYKSDVGKRIYIKSVVSLMEGVSYLLRKHMINDKKIELSQYETILMEEVTTELDDVGKIKLKPKRYNSLQMFKFTFKTFAKHYNKQKDISDGFSNNDFSKLNSTMKKRNNLTHPKSSKDFVIKETDLSDAEIAHDWLHKFIVKSFDNVFIEKKKQ